jgi:hypothetical protein
MPKPSTWRRWSQRRKSTLPPSWGKLLGSASPLWRKVIKEPTYPIIVALALMLVAPSFSSFAQREERGRFEERIPLRAPQERSIGAPRKQTIRAPEQQTMVRTQTFAGRIYLGRLAWRDGRWRHATRDGRDGWWWDVGGFWYFYPEQSEGQPEGSPDYVSEIELAEDATASPTTPAPAEPNHAVYYRPGDLTGTRYKTLEECLQVRKRAGSGECIWK